MPPFSPVLRVLPWQIILSLTSHSWCYPTTSALAFLSFYSPAPPSPSLSCLRIRLLFSSQCMLIPLQHLGSPTFVLPLILSFLILPSLVTPLIHLNIENTHPKTIIWINVFEKVTSFQSQAINTIIVIMIVDKLCITVMFCSKSIAVGQSPHEVVYSHMRRHDSHQNSCELRLWNVDTVWNRTRYAWANRNHTRCTRVVETHVEKAKGRTMYWERRRCERMERRK